ncbi:hypothetical protein [Microscilla marina]|uniref:Lipoprotein n=1 Tax=Microscilla marina ATCC 23134 TaxID=313606 RepID=A1ZSU5_MICM2|nr:hypothetical protein [Microscilla marina]EAY26509.1 hypothetical protein M23134_01679 [Microscilla marina ATCC 23134]
MNNLFLRALICFVWWSTHFAVAQSKPPSFATFVRHFPELKLRTFLDVPITQPKTVYDKGSATTYVMSKYYIPSFLTKIPADYFQAFFVNDLGYIRNDSVPVLDTSSTRAYCVGRLKYNNPQKIVTLLLALEVKDKDNYYGRQYYTLVYYTLQGKAIGYDIVGRKKWRVHTSARLSLQRGRLLVEQVGHVIQNDAYKNVAKRYWLSFGNEAKVVRQTTQFSMMQAGTPQRVEGVGYWGYCHNKLPYCVQFPAKVLYFVRKDWGKYMSEQFESGDGKALFSIKHSGVTYGDKNKEKAFNEYLKLILSLGHYREKGLNEQAKGEDFWVGKGLDKEGNITHQKLLLTPMIGSGQYNIIQATFIYPASQATHYDKIAKQLMDSFQIRQ